jgi:rhodanese-related sulfurtransferase
MTRIVDAPTLAERLGDPSTPDPTVIDVRTPVEFEAGHIPGAVNVPLDELKASLDDICAVLDDHDVVLVCRSGARAGQAQEVLQSAGLTSPAVLSGGIVDWEKTGGAVNRGRQGWELERQVRLAAGSLVVTGIRERPGAARQVALGRRRRRPRLGRRDQHLRHGDGAGEDAVEQAGCPRHRLGRGPADRGAVTEC